MSIKLKVYEKCLELVDQKVLIAQKSMKEAQESANSEEKSTAGDKYDTARAMSQIERDMHAKQFTEALHLKQILAGISISKPSKKIIVGSLVITSIDKFFMSIALGKLQIDGEDIFIISPISPLGQLLLDKKAGKKVKLNGKEIELLEVL